ncbi:SDR family oxidoreductase [Pontibacter silvestris]|uniref:SDR family oxidoreductase n=1 Tax=Pontibacter silvestris TaxID=2305183 RepID=A0ABW4WW24_9BACT|nr:SDR family oxidoreductase [Pontibacter silvestris]MCC9137428.1 SDR family oxidoreductase [Pontibacter silvestris]
MTKLQGKVAIVTGASRNIGKAIAKELAAQGAQVVVNYSSSSGEAEEVVKEITDAGGEAYAVKANVSQPTEITTLFDECISHFGKVDILVNNAGVALYRLVKDITEEDFDKVFSVNVKGVMFCMKEAATKLEKGGRIINISTSVNRMMIPTYAAYSSSKSAVEQMTRVFAKEMGSKGITVNSVSPGPVDTEFFREGKSEDDIKRFASMAALGRIGQPTDIAQVVAFLASDESSWISGQNIGANGGFA